MKHRQFATLLVVWSACASKSGDSPEPAANRANVAAPVAVEAELFPPARGLLSAAALDLLPADTAGLVVIADPAGLADRLGLCNDDSGAALGRDLQALVGFDPLHPDGGVGGSAVEPPWVVAWLDPLGSQRLLLFAAADPAAVRAAVDGKRGGHGKKHKRRKEVSRVFDRDGVVAVVLGPPSQAIIDRLEGVTAETRLTASPGFATAAGALQFGADGALYFDPRVYPILGASRGVAVGVTLDEQAVRAVAAIALVPGVAVAPAPPPSADARTAAWVAALGHRLRINLSVAPAAAADPTLSRILAARQPVAVVRGSVAAFWRGTYPPDVELARQVALRDAAEFGMIGLLGSSPASAKKRAEQDGIRTQIRELEDRRAERAAPMMAELAAQLGQVALFARTRGEVAVFYGGVFPAEAPAKLVDRAVALWHLHSAHSTEGTEIAALEHKSEQLDRAIERLDAKQFESMFGTIGGFDSDGFGGMIGSYDGLDGSGGFGGLGVSGTGPGGGGTGWGTIGTGSYGTIGHGGGGGSGSGYGVGSGGLGKRRRASSGTASGTAGGSASSPPATAATEGKLDQAVIEGYIAKRSRRLQDCRQVGVAGKARVRFVINRDGWVDSASASGLGNREVESCLEGIFSGFRFPAPRGGEVQAIHVVAF